MGEMSRAGEHAPVTPMLGEDQLRTLVLSRSGVVPQGEQGVIALHQTVRGHSHVAQDKVCQDSSYAYRHEDGSWQMTVVSDGHGDPNCMRSDRGSRMATEVAAGCLRDFAEALDEQDLTGHTLAEDLLVPARQGALLRRLTDAIVSRWVTAVREDAAANPLAADELALASDAARERYLRGERLEHAYGATLVCALWLPKALVLLQQGDGACLVMQNDGTISQPIPEDERCLANVTTSLCDEDAADSIRHAVIALQGTPVCACLLTSDGVANSFGDAGLAGYLRELLLDVTRDGDAARVAGELAESLPELSRRGSGDDMSVALLCDMSAARPLVGGFATDIERQKLQDEVASLQDKLVSMERKHAHLAQLRDDALAERDRLEREVRECQERLARRQADAEKLRAAISEYDAQRARAQRDVEVARKRYEAHSLEHPTTMIGSFAFGLVDPYERELSRLMRREAKASMRYDDALARYDKLIEDARVLGERFAQANEDIESFDMAPLHEFEDYDASYRELRSRLSERQAQLATLGTPADKEADHGTVRD